MPIKKKLGSRLAQENRIYIKTEETGLQTKQKQKCVNLKSAKFTLKNKKGLAMSSKANSLSRNPFIFLITMIQFYYIFFLNDLKTFLALK